VEGGVAEGRAKVVAAEAAGGPVDKPSHRVEAAAEAFLAEAAAAEAAAGGLACVASAEATRLERSRRIAPPFS
jgi:hypothetical protein